MTIYVPSHICTGKLPSLGAAMDMIMPFGKHSQQRLGMIANHSPGYLEYLYHKGKKNPDYLMLHIMAICRSEWFREHLEECSNLQDLCYGDGEW